MVAGLPIAVVGDVHLHFDDDDVRWFNRSDYGLILFVGDLAGYREDATKVARVIARLTVPALVIPGNHDGASLAHLGAETLQQRGLIRLFERDQPRRVEALAAALQPVPLCGYSLHEQSLGGCEVSVIAARPHSQGGSQFAFGGWLRRRFGIADVQASAQRLCELVDAARHPDVLFLAHCGPSGLGGARDDIWGCDFKKDAGDFGDSDLRAAVDHAQRSGKRVLAVVAGHMHQRIKGGGQRVWCTRRGGALYVNAARVPRIFRRQGITQRHHVRLSWAPDGLRASDQLVTSAS